MKKRVRKESRDRGRPAVPEAERAAKVRDVPIGLRLTQDQVASLKELLNFDPTGRIGVATLVRNLFLDGFSSLQSWLAGADEEIARCRLEAAAPDCSPERRRELEAKCEEQEERKQFHVFRTLFRASEARYRRSGPDSGVYMVVDGKARRVADIREKKEES